MVPYIFLLECIGFIIGVSGVFLMQVQRVQPNPYMDEIFHIPQLQHYCKGDFYHWNDKITTPPGLYAISFCILWLVSKVTGLPLPLLCSVFYIRMINVFLCAFNFFLIFWIINRLWTMRHPNQSIHYHRIIIYAMTLSVTPILFFFSVLFYTDQLSLMLVLLSLVAYYRGSNNIVLFFFTGASVFVRQTNIFWTIFILGMVLEQRLVLVHKGKQHMDLMYGVFVEQPVRTWKIAIRTLFNYWGITLVIIGFGAFVIHNGSVVVGDKEAHQVTFHLPQMFYFASLCALLSFPSFLSNFISFVGSLQRHRRFVFFMMPSCLICLLLGVHLFTMEHPYLLADNRHYTFYIWQRIFRRHWAIRYLLCPIYLLACRFLLVRLANQSYLWRLGFAICTSGALIGAPLLEPRYFIIPYIIWNIHTPVDRWLPLIVRLVFFACVNAFTIYMFIYHPFSWPGETVPSQRFMW